MSKKRNHLGHKKKCSVCGVEFKASRSDAQMCGLECRAWKYRHGTPLTGDRPLLPRMRLPDQGYYDPFPWCG